MLLKPTIFNDYQNDGLQQYGGNVVLNEKNFLVDKGFEQPNLCIKGEI